MTDYFTCSLFLDLAHSQTIYASKNPVAVGSSVTLSSNVTSGGWLFNGRLIVITLNETYDISSTWEDRVTLNTNTSSLTINPVTLKDSGSYVLENLVDGSFSQLTLLVEGKIFLISLFNHWHRIQGDFISYIILISALLLSLLVLLVLFIN